MTVSIEKIDSSLYAHTVADEIRLSIEEAVAARGRCLIALSGGKTPASIYRAFGKPPILESIPWQKVIFFWGDERWLPHSDKQSNFRLVEETLLAKLSEAKPQFFPVDTGCKTAQEGARKYEAMIRQVANVPAPEVPVFDIILLGIGEDGHTASLFPGSKSLIVTDRLCEATKGPPPVVDRVSFTLPLIKKARKIFFLVTGDRKAGIVQKIIEEDEGVDTYPATFYKEAEGAVTWFLDSPAGSLLKRD